ncbi:MAG: M48 family metalloprotease [Actinomycetia bacterium]|nr:M48 family metalloprotease [Actinomycetes bacterium]
MSEALIAAVIGLLVIPALTRRVRSSLSPAEWVRVNTASLVAGVTLFEIALIICAAPIVLYLVHGGVQRHFFPGGIYAGWVSLIGAIVIPVSLLIGILGVLSTRRRLRPDPWFGEHTIVDGMDLVVVPTATHLAFALPGRPAQIVVSQGLVDVLTESELATVIKHEAAHIRYHHSRYLLVIAALAPLFGRIRPVRESLDSLELSIECWADAAATRTAAERDSGRTALLALSHIDYGQGIAAFSQAEATAARIQALTDGHSDPAIRVRSVLYTAIGMLLFIPIVALWLFAS